MSHTSLEPQSRRASASSSGSPALRIKGTLAVASLAVMIAQIANALPGSLNGVFQQTFNTVGSQLTWITAAFMIPVVVFELTFGVLGDKYGHRKLVAGGSILVLVGSAVCAIAPQVEVMWIGSAINGLGAGAIFPASLALVAAVTHNPRDRAKGIALWAGFLSAGAAISPLLGGFAAGLGSWRGSYWVVAVLGLAAVFLSLAFAVEYRSPQSRKLDPWGQVTFAAGLILVLFGLVQGPEEGWLTPNVLIASVAGVVLLIAFVLIELRAKSPLLELSLFKNRAFTVSSIVAVVGMFAFLGACFATSMWLGPVQHQNPVILGMLFLLLQGPAFVLIPVISRLLHVVEARWLLTAGLALIGLGALLASRLEVTDLSPIPFVAPTLLIGVGFALTLSPMTAIALNTVPRQLTGMASATTNLLRDLGFVLGPVLVGAIALSAAGNQLVGTLQTADLAPDDKGAALGIAEGGGPIALNSIPAGVPGGGAHDLALAALGSGFSLAFLVCAIAAFAAAVLTLFGLRGVRDDRGSTVSYADDDETGLAEPAEDSVVNSPEWSEDRI
ncbi:EmrB/QacA subfamily drug resistance transporter [Okibacterium sp. HSC-33S16]|uniref:MFS transporter n=1 Tax=Okibacterium sp. HSC-33S16 TaxID=2910965 RepID=UPI00209F03D3|nr:MFS transporter [Okibacterium sp. HSC-33S16]MCP2032500.1 EmrB/QacA subfamily drug resistance transporter [Okibacterium sp. HSC-33S16]